MGREGAIPKLRLRLPPSHSDYAQGGLGAATLGGVRGGGGELRIENEKGKGEK